MNTEAASVRHPPADLNRIVGWPLLGYGIVRLAAVAMLWVNLSQQAGDDFAVLSIATRAGASTILALSAVVIGFGLAGNRSWAWAVGLMAGVLNIENVFVSLWFASGTAGTLSILDRGVPLQAALIADLIVFGATTLLLALNRPRLPTGAQPPELSLRPTTMSRFAGIVLVVAGMAKLELALVSLVQGNGFSDSDAHRFIGLVWLAVAGTATDVALIVSGFGLAQRRTWGRQLAGVLCLFGLYGSGVSVMTRWRFGDPYDGAAALNWVLALCYAIGLAYSLVPVRPRQVPPKAASAEAGHAPPDTHSDIPSGAGWHAALLASLKAANVQPVSWDNPRRVFFLVASLVVLVGAERTLNQLLPGLLGGARFELRIAILTLFAVFDLAVVARLSTSVLHELWQRGARSAVKELDRDSSRRPLLYLRSFALDEEIARPTIKELLFGTMPTHNAEQRLAKLLGRCGPVIAIGRPGEKLPGLGAARFYVSHDLWHLKVADVAKASQLVVWTTGTTEGLRWEISHLMAELPPERLIVWAHPHLLHVGAAEREAEWARFRSTLGTAFRHPFPERLGRTRFFYFTADGAPVAVATRRRWWSLPFFWLRDDQTAALRQLLVAKGLRPFDAATLAVKRRRRRIVLGAVASVAILAAVAFGDFVHQVSQESQALADADAWDRLGEAFMKDELLPDREQNLKLGWSSDALRTPQQVLEQYHTLLQQLSTPHWLFGNWEGLSSAKLAELVPIASDYAMAFDEIHRFPAVEDLVYCQGMSARSSDVADAADAQARLQGVSRALEALTRFKTGWDSLKDSSGERAFVDSIADLTSRRLDLLKAEIASLRILVDHTAAWTKAQDGLDPQFADIDLQDQYDDALEAENAAYGGLSDVLKPMFDINNPLDF